MRWVVLPLSFGTAVMSVIYGMFMKWMGTGSTFTWLTFTLLIVSAILAMIGGLVAFNGRRAGGLFLIAASILCFCVYRDAWFFGVIYLVGGLLAFAVPRSIDDGYDDEEGEDDEPDDDPLRFGSRPRKDERFQGISYGKRRERAAALLRTDQQNKEEYRVEDDNLERLNKMVKERHSKVCLNCGNTVGNNHNFCYHCGNNLVSAAPHGQEEAAPDEIRRAPENEDNGQRRRAFADVDDRDGYGGFGESDAFDQERQESRPASRNFSEREYEREREPEPQLYGEPEEDSEDYDDDGKDGKAGKAGKAGKNSRRGEDVEQQDPRAPSSHRVFVKPQEEQHVFKRSVIIDPDDSYQEFSAYTRRRKRRRHSLPRRILGVCLILALIGGAAWFLRGLHELTWPDGNTGVLEPAPEPSSPPDVAIPAAEPVPVVNEPPAIQIENPARGVVTGSNVNVRPDHSTAGTAITRLSENARAEVLGQWEGLSGTLSGPWYNIRINNNREGWIYGEYFQPLDRRDATLPAGYTEWLLKTFGADKTELLSGQLGQPSRQTATAITWDGLTAGVRDDEAITRLQLTSAKHVLQNGIAVGMDEAALYRNIGYPSEYRSGQLRYIESGSQGIVVRLQNNKVQNITVGNI